MSDVLTKITYEEPTAHDFTILASIRYVRLKASCSPITSKMNIG